MSFLILCAKGGRFEGEGAFGESGMGRLWAFESSPAKLHQFAGAVLRLDQPVFLGGGEESAAEVALCSAER